MNICMLAHNNGTRDGRLMREAHTLRAAGHEVTVVGIPESGITRPHEELQDGIKVLRVDWYANARRRFRRSGIPRAILFAAACGGLGYGLYRMGRWLADAASPIVARLGDTLAREIRAATLPRLLVVAVAAAAVIYAARRVLVLVRIATKQRSRQDEMLRRHMMSGEAAGRRFPAIRTRIPNWIPDWVLEVAVEPLGWLGARTARFSFQRYRSEALAAAAIQLKPDVIHCHDCIALPTGWLIKNALGIPLVYDAHEIYEAVAARRPGATDYFGRVHHKYLPRVDGFIAVNDSAANYYRHACPSAPRAVVIRNAMDRASLGPYDGRLHRAAGLSSREKIVIYQGGYTKLRGLETLVRAAPLLPEGWSLVMMGSGVLSDELKTITKALQGAGAARAHFVPAVPSEELLSWTQGATVGIIPYEDKVLNHWIATPNKLWEYPNAGVPMIVQPFFEMRRIVETYGCGWVLPEEFNPAAIANLIASLTEEMILAAREGCRRFIEVDNWSTIYKGRLLQLYDGLERRTEVQRTPGAEVAEVAV